MNIFTLVYLLPAIVVLTIYVLRQRQAYSRNLTLQEQAKVDGMHEPASLHPLINASMCIGCGSCVSACPEQSVLGLINQKAELIAAANCIGHGACRSACPVGAIALVLGTEKRGVEIPHVNPDFETNVPGIFIAGELGGMGLIRNAAIQGVQAINNLRLGLPKLHHFDCDVLIVGSGPAGIAASLAARQAGLNYKTIDQDTLGGTVAHFPRRKIVMTQPVVLPLAGQVRFRETTKESLLSFWQDIVTSQGLDIHFGERLERIEALDGGFSAVTSSGITSASKIVLCVGRRGTPRRLGVKGEELAKVVYRLLDPEQYQNLRVLVVGGGDSAVEAALSIAEQAETQVKLVYRGAALNRVKLKNRTRLEQATTSDRLEVLLNTDVSEINEASVALLTDGKINKLDNDAVIICAGGIMPRTLLESIGIKFDVKYGTQ